MTTTLRAQDGRIDLAVNDTERTAAEQALGALSLIVLPSEPESINISVPSELVGLMTRVLDAVANGDKITIGSLPSELSTAVAASQLGVSRPTLMKLIAEGQIPAHKVGSHARLKTEDVFAFRRARLARQRDALDRLRALEDGLG